MTKTKIALSAALLLAGSSLAMAQQPVGQQLYDLSVTGAGTYEVPAQGQRATVQIRNDAGAAFAYAPAPAGRTLTDAITFTW